MFKSLFFIFTFTLSLSVQGAVTARWLTVASVAIDDGKTKLLFDPAWTRPGVFHWFGIETLKSNEVLVKSVLSKNGLNKVDAVFASHSHFDHVIDAPMVSKLAGAVFYADESNERLARAYKDEAIKTLRINPNKKIKIGDFSVTPVPRDHAAILHLFDFLPGPVPENTNLNFWDYRLGETWFYIIEHPEGVILLDQGSAPYIEDAKKHAPKIDVIIQGVANRKTDEVTTEGYVKTFLPKVFIPVHFDNFFADFSEGNEGYLPGIRLDEVLEKMKKAYPTMNVNRPWYGKPITILEAKR